MKRCINLILSILLITTGASGCPPAPQNAIEAPPVLESRSGASQIEPTQPQSIDEPADKAELDEVDNNVTSIILTTGSSVFSVKLYDNEAATAFLARLPMTLNMSELNGNEKYCYLSDSLPTNSLRVENINAGDLMLYNSDCLVLFYESFNTTYSYTKLGYIEDISELADVLGSGSVEVAITINESEVASAVTISTNEVDKIIESDTF